MGLCQSNKKKRGEKKGEKREEESRSMTKAYGGRALVPVKVSSFGRADRREEKASGYGRGRRQKVHLEENKV